MHRPLHRPVPCLLLVQAVRVCTLSRSSYSSASVVNEGVRRAARRSSACRARNNFTSVSVQPAHRSRSVQERRFGTGRFSREENKRASGWWRANGTSRSTRFWPGDSRNLASTPHCLWSVPHTSSLLGGPSGVRALLLCSFRASLPIGKMMRVLCDGGAACRDVQSQPLRHATTRAPLRRLLVPRATWLLRVVCLRARKHERVAFDCSA